MNDMSEDSERPDHRKIGRELDLFAFSDLIGSGLPLFTPKGAMVRNLLIEYSESLQMQRGFEKVWAPHITKTDLYKTSGHWDKFGHELFLVQSQETKDQFVLKPMNCPHITQIYASRPRSYRDLPIRYVETTTMYRDEKSGELSGLSRVRSLTQDDAHVFARMDQIEGEFESILGMIKELYETLGMSFKARLSFRDPGTPDKYLGDAALWSNAEEILESVAKKSGLEYFKAVGEAAFYGPKIDILITDSLGREWQCGTEQLDFVQPMRFKLEYIDSDGQPKTPVMIHKALLGSVERFLSVYIEHTGGVFPVWLSPVQAKILPIGEGHLAAAKEAAAKLRTAGIRVEVDESAETLGKKIREAKTMKIPYLAVVGDQEVKDGTATVEGREGKLGAMNVSDFENLLLEKIRSKALS